MVKVRSLDRSVRNGALVTGIPLAVSGLIPWSIEPDLVFVWTVASQSGEIWPLLPAAAGIMLLAVALIPGLPRILRGLLLLAFTAVPLYLIIEPIDSVISGHLPELPGGASIGSEPLIFLAAIAAAATLELIGQGMKASRVGAALALIGWLGFSLQYFLPIYGPKPLVVLLAEGMGNVFGAPMGMLTVLASAMMLIAALYLLLGIFGSLFALKRLLSSIDRRLAGGFKSGWAGVMMGGAPAIIAAAPIVVALGDELEAAGVLVGTAAVLMLWGFGTGLTGGLAHTVLGFIPTPKPSTGNEMARPVYQPQGQDAQQQREVRPATLPPHEPQPAPSDDRAAIEAAQAAIRQQQEMEAAQQRAAEASQQQMQAQQYQQQQQQAAQMAQAPQAGSPLPRGGTLQAYPGYPGYVVCPACGGGVAVNAPSCTHCNQPIAWG